ncbi:MAG: putative branched-chain amino acid transporter permease protein [Frankiales bacterium]|nr:putative branched-chain amino acid transporter permease protein [Frankiales bacterium]
MTVLLTGASLGALYILLALGYSLIWVGAGVFHFAQAQMMMLGTLFAYVAATRFGLPLAVVPLVCAVVGFLIGLVVHYMSIESATALQGSSVLVTTLAAAVIIDGIAARTFGTTGKAVPFWGKPEPLTIAGGRITIAQLVVIAAAIAIGALLTLLRSRTIYGVSAVAASEDRTAARLKGIDVRRIAAASVALAGAMAGAVGIIVAQQTGAVAGSGGLLAVKGFLVLALGGFGSIPGAVLGGVLIGMIEAYSARWIGSQYTDVILFGVLLAVLLIRPGGLFIQHRARMV